MNQLNSFILGIVQGATEFLPISSSAHLVLGQHLLGIREPGLLLEIVLHLGTLVSVLIYFRNDIRRLVRGSILAGRTGGAVRREIGYLVVATLPAVAVGLTLKDTVEAAFDNVAVSGYMLLVTSAVLLSSRWCRDTDRKMTWLLALAIGTAQAIAIMPGISRSGVTIIAGLWLGLGGPRAARFSFLLAIPAILGAAVLQLPDLAWDTTPYRAEYFMAFLVSAATGYAVIAWLLAIIKRGQLFIFAGYTTLVGLIVIFVL